MQVCKDCRAEWMLALCSWFFDREPALMDEAEAKVRPDMSQLDDVVPIRVFGATVSVPVKKDG
jgi:hypothetical protein